MGLLENALNVEETRACQAHLAVCETCRNEYASISRLQQRLVASGRLASDVTIVEPVMRRVLRKQIKPERTSIMSRLLQYRWGFGLGAAGAAAAILMVSLAPSNAQARAAAVLAKGARAIAKYTSVHLRGQVRTRPQDNFSHIDPACGFHSIEMWKQFTPVLKWRAEKPGRVAVMDGQSTTLYISTANYGLKLPLAAPSAFDTEWLHRLASLSAAIENEVKNAQTKGWKLGVESVRGLDGRNKSVVTVEAKSGLPDNDYLKNKFVDTSDTRRVYRFDEETELLEAVQVYMMRPAGEVLIFELQQIDYDQAWADSLFQLQLPANVVWLQEMQRLPDNAKYASMTAEQACRAFFEACSRNDWDEAAKFSRVAPVMDKVREYYGGLKLISVGESFTSEGYPGRFVPYEVKLTNGETKKFNLALKRDGKTQRWWLDGGY